jgi:hypothetical protein
MKISTRLNVIPNPPSFCFARVEDGGAYIPFSKATVLKGSYVGDQRMSSLPLEDIEDIEDIGEHMRVFLIELNFIIPIHVTNRDFHELNTSPICNP